MRVEGVAREQHEVGLHAPRRLQHHGEIARAVAAPFGRRGLGFDVQVGAVNDDNFPAH